MGDKKNFAALDWVIGEIEETLTDARSALESFVEDPKDSTKMRFCLTHIHQVYGSLQMVEFHGASLVAEEMEHLAQALMNNAVSSGPEAQEVLMRSMLQLPIYLEHVKAQKDDNPAVVLPLLNDLRAVRKQSYLTETNLFSPDLTPLRVLHGKRHPVTHDGAKLGEVLNKLREMYQFAAASVLRDIKIDENLAYLDKVCSRLELLTGGTACYPLWEVSSAMIDGLRRGELKLSVAVRGLLRHLARELRILAEKAPGSLDLQPRESLIKNLLYYVARAKEGSPKVAAIKQKFKLADALRGTGYGDDSATMSVPDPEAIRSVVVALQDEINTIKHILDLSLSGQSSTNELKEVLPVVKRVADTLAVLGIGDLRKQVLEQAEVLETLSNQNELDGYQLMEVANKVIEFENRLSAVAKVAGRNQDFSSLDEREVEIDQAKRTVLKECQRGLEQAKDAIVEYISSQWDKSHLENIGVLLVDIRGGLDMIPLPRPGEILNACKDFIEDKLVAGDSHPEWKSLDALADAIASIEYYLERLIDDFDEDLESLLDVAEESVSLLGYKVPAKDSGSEEKPEVAAEPAPAVVDTAGSVVEREQMPVEIESGLPEQPEDNFYEEPVEENIEMSALPVDEPITEQAEPEPEPEPEPEIQKDTAAPVAKVAPSISLDMISVGDDEEESDIDDEIIEIFIEEAGEVSETLAEYFPQWKSNQHDSDALVVVRRAFHTLKGSGRMVEASDIGELAWSVENMLNRVLDRTVPAKPAHSHLIMLVLGLLPTLIEAFKNKQKNPQQALTEQYMAWGQALSEGEIPEELLEEPDVVDMSPPQTATPEVVEHSENIETVVSAADDSRYDLDMDEENEDMLLWGIFSSEAETHLETMEDFISQMEEAAPLYVPPTDDVQRAMHTLKGSAKMAQVTPIAELVEPLENFAKELISYQVNINADILQLLKDAVEYTREGLTYLESGREVQIPKMQQFLAREAELRELAVGHLIRLKELEKQGGTKVDPQLLSIFMAEEMKLLLDADEILVEWQKNGIDSIDLPSLINELSLLERGAERANLPDMTRLSQLLRSAHEAALINYVNTDEHFFTVVARGHESLLDMVDAIAAGQNLLPPAEEVEQAFIALQKLVENTDEDHVDISQLPVVETTEDSALSDLQPAQEIDYPAIEEPVSEFEEPSAEFNEEPSAEFSEEPSAEYQEPSAEFNEEPSTDFNSDSSIDFDEAVNVEAQENNIEENFNTFSEVEEEPSAENQEPSAEHQEPSAEYNEKPSAEHQEPSAEYNEEPSAEFNEEPSAEDTEPSTEYSAEYEVPPAESAEEPPTSHTYQAEYVEDAPETPALTQSDIPGMLDSIDVEDEDFDEDILEVFIEEAEELIEELDEAVHAWESDWSDVDSVEEIKRALHTLKGGARLAGMPNLGQLTHEYESYLIGKDIADVDGVFFAKIHDYQDKVLTAVRGIQQFMGADVQSIAAVPPVSQPEPEVVAPGPTENNAADSVESSDSETNVLPFAAKAKDATASVPSVFPGGEPEKEFIMPQAKTGGGQAATQAVARKAGPQEVIKVSADLLEELVNLAGETSISRGRLEEQVNDFGTALEEIDGTIERLQEQLRRLDIETEAQVLFRQEQIEEYQKDFDPLEMDRYSALQQLSRSLIESASDLVDLKSTLADKVKDTETLLLQQSRVNSTLQEGLMRSRMVPFSRLVPRLRRIVRQVASELGKQVSFELDNVEGELDRSVLERMIAPLEHMLRNAVDHGIEMPADRVASGKAEAGRVVLTLGREGGDVLLRLADDGRGIDLKRVREKAIERGLMTADANLSDHDVMQFILHAGFSTAENVTQISGRGVGMDVVYAEIKQLGGSVSINSSWGKGTEFFVRLPFTVSVNRALMVELGTDHYAVPLNTIEGIVRVSPFELEHYYSDPEARFEYAGEKYQVRYLGTMLNEDIRPRLEGKSLPIPVLLVRSAEHTMALQVDALLGSREIVVKTLGQQFSSVQGLSGATVMGDGSVVVILDSHALVRKEMALSLAQSMLLEPTESQEPAEAEPEDKINLVMVVDDSVTVRKVTTRFLEREGFEVITAKDGVDALAVLQDTIPDVMLLDIEMPRMDGFEVAKNIRSSSRWKGIPIIMITSRTGDKHRDHALSLGVNKYLGKPYQEELLLESLNELLAESAAKNKR